MIEWLHGAGETPIVAAAIATLISGWLATSLGAFPALVLPRLTLPASTVLVSVAAGLMLGASIFSLLLPALEVAAEGAETTFGPTLSVTAWLLVGAIALDAANRWVPHEHFVKGHEGTDQGAAAPLPRAMLFAVAIAIHNFPEGLSVGVGAASGDAAVSGTLVLAIALQNLPEGLVVALGLRGSGFGRWQAFALASVTGLLEVVGGIAGGASLALSERLLPWALAFAAGAMLYVISDEIIPESHRPGLEFRATASLFAGLAAFLLIDALVQDWATGLE